MIAPATIIDIFGPDCHDILTNYKAARYGVVSGNIHLKNLTWTDLNSIGLDLIWLNKLQYAPPGHIAVYAIEELTRRCQEKGLSIF